MRLAWLLALALCACSGCHPAQPVAHPVVSPPATQDAAVAAPGTVKAACLRLCAVPCSKWCGVDGLNDCMAGMTNLVASGIGVDLGCLANVMNCDDTINCTR
jgi:hypothetical protein